MNEIKFKVENWMPSLAAVCAVVSSKNVIPILSSVLIDSHDGSYCTLTASDGETWVTEPVAVESADANIKVCVNAADLIKTLKNLNGECLVSLSIDKQSHIATFYYGNGHFSLPFSSSVDYPIPSDVAEDGSTMFITANKLANAIGSVSWAAGNDTIRPILNVLHFEFSPNGLSVCCTDATKLAVYKDAGIKSTDGFINIPQRPANTLLGVISSMGEEDVNVRFNDKAVVFKSPKFSLITRLTEGHYPNYESIIPKEAPVIVKINKDSFIDMVRRIAPLGSSSELISLNFTSGLLVANTEDLNFSKSASEKIECDYFGSDFKIGFKGSYLLEILRGLQGDTAVIELTDQTRAALFYGDGAKETYIAVLAPMAIS